MGYQNDPLSMPSLSVCIVPHGKAARPDVAEAIFVDAPERQDGKIGIDVLWQSDTMLHLHLKRGQVRSAPQAVDVEGQSVSVQIEREAG
jgi:hypothetical protein